MVLPNLLGIIIPQMPHLHQLTWWQLGQNIFGKPWGVSSFILPKAQCAKIGNYTKQISFQVLKLLGLVHRSYYRVGDTCGLD